MRIAIDGYEANVTQRLGSSQVAFELLRHLEKIDHQNDYIIDLPNTPINGLPKERTRWKYKILKPKKLWTRIALPLALYTTKQKPDIFFSPTHYIPRFVPSSVKKVVTIFDLSFLHFPEMFTKGDLWKLKNWTDFSVRNADHIITISNFSKKDIIEHYGVDKTKITVAYPGYDQSEFSAKGGSSFGRKVEEAKRRYKTGDNYLIYIGTLQPRKNLIRLINVVAKIDGLNLVVVGKSSGEGREGWMFQDILDRPKDLGVENRVVFTGFMEIEELQPLLTGSLALIQPSLWEGFGIPVVEAMACGVPVIVSNASSLPEVVGNAGLLFDPYSEDQMEQAIRTMMNDKRLRAKSAKMGPKQAEKFSWNKMARGILRVFEKL